MAGTSNKRRHIGAAAMVVLLAFLLSVLFPTNIQARTVKAKTGKGTYTIENALRGIDVSKWNGTVNWKSVAGDSVDFAFARATYGTDNDPTFVTNAKGAYQNGVHIGAYHYARFKTSAEVKKEANAFLKQVKKVTLTYPVVLDIENHYNLSKSKLTSLALEFCKHMEDAGYKVIIYTYQNFFNDRLNVSSLKGYSLWVANYNQRPSGITHAVWQHSSTGRVSGVKGNVDLNVAYKSLAVRRLPGQAAASTSSSNGEQDTTPARGTSSTLITDQDRQSVQGSTGTKDATPIKPASTSGTKESSASSSTAAVAGTLASSDDKVVRLIGSFLDQQYQASFNKLSSVNTTDMHNLLDHAFQIEINKQLGGSVDINGNLGDAELQKLAEIDFQLDKTQGRITTLLQSKLYAMDYLGVVNGRYDSDTLAAIKALQSDSNLEPTGVINQATWRLILGL